MKPEWRELVQKGKPIVERWRTDYSFKTFLSAGGSLAITFLFSLYNAYLGIWHQSIWYGSISAYYIFLTIIRGTIILTQDRLHRKEIQDEERIRRWVFLATAGLLVLMNLVMAVPISLLVEFKKPVRLGLYHAIAMAAYTTYKITFAAINYRKKNKSDNYFVKELRTINLIDAILSVITLQNTLIMAMQSEGDRHMLILSAVTSAIMLIEMVVISVAAFRRGRKELFSR